MKYSKIFKLKYFLLIFLLFFEMSTAQARNLLGIRSIISSVYQSCKNALNTNSPSPTNNLLTTNRLPPPFESEQQLRDQGYSEKYIAGLDHARDNIQLAERLRADEIDSSTSHIKEFADLIDKHVEFIEEGIESQESDDKETRLGLLELLKSEAQERQNLEQVTYLWWFNFNFRLSILATPIDKLPLYFKDINTIMANKTIGDNIKFLQGLEEKAIDRDYRAEVRSTWHRVWYLSRPFPERFIIPTIHPLGQASINETHGTGVHFVGLKNRVTRADRTDMQPYFFFLHDMGHAVNIEDIGDPQLASYVRQEINRFPKPQRQALWYIFYEVTYERGSTLGFVRSAIVLEPPDISRADIEEGKAALVRIIRDGFYML